jgi:hypothetical protein
MVEKYQKTIEESRNNVMPQSPLTSCIRGDKSALSLSNASEMGNEVVKDHAPKNKAGEHNNEASHEISKAQNHKTNSHVENMEVYNGNESVYSEYRESFRYM